MYSTIPGEMNSPSGDLTIGPISKEEYNEGLEARNARTFDSFHAPMTRLLSPEEFAQVEAIRCAIPEVPGIYVGAKLGDRLVGYSHSFYKNGASLRTMISAVDPEFRRQGIYTAMTQYILDQAKGLGFQRVESAHQVTNNSVIIAKLKLGFVIYGSEYNEEFGPLVVLAKFLIEKRRKLFGFRMGEFVPNREYLESLGLDLE